jgi:predicted permease
MSLTNRMSMFRVFVRSIRSLLRTPSFAVVVVLVLTFGIAASTTIFTLVDELVLYPFPYRDPTRLLMIWESNPALGAVAATRVQAAWNNFEAWRTQNRSFEAVEAFQINIENNLTGLKNPESLRVARSSPGLFAMLGVSPVLGRTFLPGDDTPGNHTVILTQAFSANHFGNSDPLGRTLLLDGVPHSIIGVLPREFHLPALFEGSTEYKPDVWLPLAKVANTDPPQLAKRRRLLVCARLNPGISITQATADLREIARRRAQEDPELNTGYSVNLFSLDEENTQPDLRNELNVLLFAAVLVLLLACVSLAGLTLIRTAGRRKDMGIMAALGASRWALMEPVLGESLVLGAIASLLGFIASYAGVRLIVSLKPGDILGPERLATNFHAFLFNSCISIVALTIFGLVPAWLAARRNPVEALKANGAWRTDKSYSRSALVAVQIAVALTLAIGATLLMRTFERLLQVDPGFRAQQVLTAHLVLPSERYANLQDRARFCRNLREKLRSLPGVESAALVDNMPLLAIRYAPFEIEGRPIVERNAGPSADFAWITTDFFSAMNITLRRGRLFTEQDAETNPPNVVIVNEALVRQFWPNQDPIGSHIRHLPPNRPPEPWQTVIGVVADFHQWNLETPVRPELFWPTNAFSDMTVVVRTATANPGALSTSLQATVHSLDADEPVSHIQTLDEIVALYASQRHFNMLVFSVFAGVSILLMLVGMYGLISSFISSHRRDIGVRVALGARRSHICLSLLLPALPPVLAGITLGLILSCIFSFLAKRLLASLLFHVSPLDPVTYVVIPVALLAVLIFTSFLATIQAAQVDPARVLRED